MGAMLAVGLLGVLRVDLNASVLAVFLTLEIAVVTIYIIGALTRPAGGVVSAAGFFPNGGLSGQASARSLLWESPASSVSNRARSTAKSVGTPGSRWPVQPSFRWP